MFHALPHTQSPAVWGGRRTHSGSPRAGRSWGSSHTGRRASLSEPDVCCSSHLTSAAPSTDRPAVQTSNDTVHNNQDWGRHCLLLWRIKKTIVSPVIIQEELENSSCVDYLTWMGRTTSATHIMMTTSSLEGQMLGVTSPNPTVEKVTMQK